MKQEKEESYGGDSEFEEMWDLVYDEMHDLSREFVRSRWLKLGSVFYLSDFPDLLLYFDNIYMFADRSK